MSRKLPSFSIIVPTFSRPKALESCLEAFSRLDYPRDRFEVIVVDDGSALSPEKTVTPFRTRIDITLYEESHAGPAAARNKGASRAKGEFLAFTDDDCRPDRRWLRVLVGRLAANPESIVGGRVINALKDNVFSATSQLLIDYLDGYFRNISAPSFTSNNLALARRTFLDLGGFDTRFPLAAGEDRDFCRRARRQGRQLVFCHDSVVYHWQRLTFSGFWRQHFRYGRGAFWYHKDSGPGNSFEPPMFYVNLVLSPFLRRSSSPTLMFGLMVISQVAIALGFFKQKRASQRYHA